MTVSIDATTRKYHGRMAETYESKRTKQQRWHQENAAVKRFLVRLRPRSVIDVPCGTGRFLPLYDRLRVSRVLAVDVSDEMLAQAKEKPVKKTRVEFKRSDVRRIATSRVDAAVCVRFLDLIDEAAMHAVVKTLCSVATRGIICTIRLGPTYVAKSNTATHDEKKFRALLRKHGWRIAKDVPIFTQGWHVFLLTPRS